MANLDEKLLDGPNVGYCSSSDEDEPSGSTFRPSNSSASTSQNQSTSTDPRTGPKGVLADYKREKRAKRAEQRAREEELLVIANRFSLETPGNKQPVDGEEEEDELDRIRQRRIEQLRSMAKGRIMEIPDRFEFLQLIEQQPRECLLFMHIYADGNDQSERLNEALLELAGRVGSGKAAKFYKIQTKVLGTTQKFSKDALPALQVYQAEQLVGNFIRLNAELGDDYNGQDLVRFLQRNGIFLELRDGQ